MLRFAPVCFAALMAAWVSHAQEAPSAPAAHLDLATLPANRWVERPLHGWPGKTWYGPGLYFGFCSAGSLGIVVLDWANLDGNAHIRELKTARVRRLDLAGGLWSEHAAAPLEPAFKDFHGGNVLEHLHGTQLCYDSDRKVLVGLTTTNLDGRGRTVEFDLEAKRAAGHKPDPSPPVVTAASLCYDPVNQEVVLATGGFASCGGTEGTWLYDGGRKQWRRLEGPAEVEAVRGPLEAARDRLVTLRWLTWKNLEFRVTDREERLDERARSIALSKEAAALAAEFRKLAAAAGRQSAQAARPYHQARLAEAAKLLAEADRQLAGAEAKLASGSPEEFEALHRGSLLPAQESVECAATELAVTPEPRMNARLAFDSRNKVILCFGGNGQRRGYGDTWIYHCEGRWWERRNPLAHPPAQECRTLVFDAQHGVFVMNFGWLYDAASNEWRQLPVSCPVIRTAGKADVAGFWAEYDASSGCLVAFNHDMNKAWVLRLDPAQAKPATPAAPREPAAPDGEFCLRDAATLAQLQAWKASAAQWAKEMPANTWVAVPTHGTGRPNWGRSWSSIVYDPGRLQLYYRDGGHGSYHGADTDHYDIPTGRWFRSGLRDLPPWPMGSYFAWGRSFSYAPWAVHTYKYNLFYNPLSKRLQRTVGQSGRFEGMSGVAEYDPDTGQWARELVPFSCTVPGVPDGLIAIDNFTRYGTKNGEGTYRTAAGTREFKNLGPLPRPYDDHAFCWFFDPHRKRALYYGGPKEKQELFALDAGAAEPKWTNLHAKAAGERKLPLASREVVYVPRHDTFLMIAGNPYKGKVALWALDPSQNLFREVKLGGPALQDTFVSQGLQYDPVTDLCFFIAVASGAPPMYAFRYVPTEE